VSSTVVIAPDSFKGTLSATLAAQALAEGWASVRPDDELRLLPQADGGEGTLDAIEAATPGAVRRSIPDITGPDGRRTTGEWLELPGGTAVVELAQCAGLPLMARLDPLGATTRGLGDVIAAALAAGATSLVVGLGGSASTDAGAGALEALGLRLLDSKGAILPHGGGALASLHRVDASRLATPPKGGVTLLTDVDTPLLGHFGAAAVFGPQKGADAGDVLALDAALSRFALIVGGDPMRAGSGAAGGTGFGFANLWGAAIEPGARRIAALSGLTAAIGSADVVLTGEGRFDSQSLSGKVVGSVLGLAGTTTVGIVAGAIAIAPETAWSTSLEQLAGSQESAMADPELWLRAAGALAAQAL
jgi:glycerate 2-kinase